MKAPNLVVRDTPLSGTTEADRARAMKRSRVVVDYHAARATGESSAAAQKSAATIHDVSSSSVRRWADGRTGLVDGARAGRPVRAFAHPGAEEAWLIYKNDYLRLEAPASAACYRRVQALARLRGWVLPSEVAFRRRLKAEISAAAIIRAREGMQGLLTTHPRQVRSVAELAPLDWICGDGRKHDLFVMPLAGSQAVRPVVWYWQDVYSRRILAWRAGLVESAELVRLALADVCIKEGVPLHVLVDNTRAAAAKWLSGGSQNRQRWHSSQEDVPGIMALLGIRPHHSGVERSAIGKGIGRGWAKPVERAFRDLAETIDKHPAARGAYTGNSTLTKPENYGQRAIGWAVFKAMVDECVAAHNAQTGRRTEAAAGGSFNSAWENKISSTPIRKLTQAQQALLLLAVETTKIKRDGTLALQAGRGTGLPANRYYHPSLVNFAGKQLVARFDPADLHSGIFVYDAAGRYLCQAECLLPVGFSNTEAAKTHRRAQRQHKKAIDAELAAQEIMDGSRIPLVAVPTPPSAPAGAGAYPKILRMVPNPIDTPTTNPASNLRARLTAGRRQQAQDQNDGECA